MNCEKFVNFGFFLAPAIHLIIGKTVHDGNSKQGITCNFFAFRHLDFFDMIRSEDEGELAKRYGVVSTH